MALRRVIQDQSLQALKSAYSKKLTPDEMVRLEELNRLAAMNDVALDRQSRAVFELIERQLKQSSTAEFIYSMIVDQMDREADENKRLHRTQGHFDIKNIHQRGLRDQLQDHDMTMLMPKSHRNIEVLAPVNRFDSSTDLVREGIATALINRQIQHIIIPVGPGHWRGMYLTKPLNDKGLYHLELFDPFGPVGADAIRQLSLDLLEKCGIRANQITIETTGPTHRQTDGYACGDFTCAYSHKKMHEFGASDAHYKQELITALENHGNNNDALRHASRKVTQSSTSIPAVESHRQERQNKPSTTSLSKLSTPDKQIFTTTISAQKNPTSTYRETVKLHIEHKNNIFSKANEARKKEEAFEKLSDEELAAKLQAEEFTRVGIKPN